MEPKILHVDMNAFFASVEQQADPRLRGQPILVCGNRTHRTVVATASYEARAFGITTGMPLSQALRILPWAKVIYGDPIKYVETSQRIFQIICDYSDLVEIFSVDEAFVDVTHTEHLFGGDLAIARLIKARIKAQFGLTCSIGIGPNKLIAKLASSMQKPDGLVIIRPVEVSQVLERLPVEELSGIGPKIAQALFQMGILTCGDLARADEGRLVRRFGILGRDLLKMGQGALDDPVRPAHEEEPIKSIGHSTTLDHDTFDLDLIHATLLMLAEKVGRRLRWHHLAGRTVGLIVRYSDFETLTRQYSLDHCLDDGLKIFQVARFIGQQHRLFLNRSIRLLGISVSGLSQQENSVTLFPEEWRRHQLLEALDQINDRYGEFTLMRASLFADRPHRHHYQIKGLRVRL